MIYSSEILINFLDTDQSKSLKLAISPNSYNFSEFLINDEKISIKSKEIKTIIKFPLNFLIIYKCNHLLENFLGNLSVEIPEITLKYYLSNGYATPSNSLKFNTISSGAKQTCLFNFKGKNNETSNNNISFLVKRYTQIIIVQMLNADNTIIDSDSIKISDILYYFDEKKAFKHTLVFNNKPFIILIRLNKEEIKAISEGKSQEISKNDDIKSKLGNIQNITDEKNKGKKRNVSDLDQIKQRIQNIKKENANLTTQFTREQKILALKKKNIEELEGIIKREEVTNTANSDKNKKKPLDQAKINKARELFNSICVCGAANPKFKGYCGDCLKKMKSEYEKILNEYLPLNDKLENLSQKNQNHLSKSLFFLDFF